jgi:hypothetical protein
MSRTQWYGDALFPDADTRDVAIAAINDYVDATQGTVAAEYMSGADLFPAGCTSVNNILLNEQHGPGLRWSFLIPDAQQDAWLGVMQPKVFSAAIDYVQGQVGSQPD